MRKLLLLSILICGVSKGQIEKNFGNTPSPVPSAASFTSYTNTPVSLATGVPDVSIPIFTLPTSNKNISIPIRLRYHVYNVGLGKPSGEVGLGWSLSKGGVISRVINLELDEKHDNASKSNYKKNVFDDIYYYNIPSGSGKFKFVRDTINNTFTLNNISGNNVKIEFTKTSNTATLILNSFKITDDKGFKYVFDDYSVASKDNYKTNYKSAFYLSKILDENDIQVVEFSYQKEAKYSGTFLKYQNCIITGISTAYGNINFENNYEQHWENYGNSDPNRILSTTLYDTSGRQISKYKFEYSTINEANNPSEEKRILAGLYEVDKNQNTLESRFFSYSYASSPYLPAGVLYAMRLPEGGQIVYNYEPNEIYKAVNYSDVDNYTVKYPEIQQYVSNPMFFDTNNSKQYTFQVDSPRAVFVTMDDAVYYKDQYHLGIHVDPETYNYQINYVVKKDGIPMTSSGMADRYLVTPGTYTIEITKGFGNGNFIIGMIQTTPPPYRNAENINIGARIKEIQYYDATSMKNRVTYEYNTFEDSSKPSSLIVSLETCQSDEYEYLNSLILYKNVKEIYGGSSSSLGFSKYYFKTPADFPGTDLGFKPHYNIISGGLLYKKETYDAQSHLISNDDTEYVLAEIANAPMYNLCIGTSKASWMQSIKTTSKTFFTNGSSLENISEATYSPVNFEPLNTKVTTADGKVTEKNIKYPSDLNNTRLVNARILSVPLEVEVKVNGKVISKAETKYDDFSNLYPSSIVSYNMQNQNQVTGMTLDKHDEKGNLVQVSDKSNFPTTTIWGYRQTQPIAKIEGLTYNQVINLQAVISAINASNADADNPANESSLLQALENLRKDTLLKNYSVTTYTYDPLVGITNSISPNGMKTTYGYDNANRLIKITDANGKILKEYQYNYRQ